MYNLTLNAEYKTNIDNYTRINTSKNSQKTSMKPGWLSMVYQITQIKGQFPKYFMVNDDTTNCFVKMFLKTPILQ